MVATGKNFKASNKIRPAVDPAYQSLLVQAFTIFSIILVPQMH